MKADKSNFYGYNKRLQPFANKLRKEMTRAEGCPVEICAARATNEGYQFAGSDPH